QPAERVRAVAVVVDDQDAFRAARRKLRGALLRGVRLAPCERQTHDELAAFADAVAARLDAAAVQIDEPPHERQPDAEPADETLAALRALIELVEDPRQVFARDADAAVLDADPNVLRVAPRRDAHRARALGEF